MALSKLSALALAAASLLAAPRAFATSPTLTNPTLSTNAVTGAWFPVPYTSSTTFNTQIAAQDISTGVYISSINPNGLIVLWHFDEASGATANDSSGQNDNGTLVNAPTRTTGVFGNALQFNGTNQQVYGSTQFSVEPNTVNEECWFKTTTTTGGKLITYENAQTGNGTNYDANLYMSNSGQILYGNYNSGAGQVQTVTSPRSYNDGNWHHVVAQTSPTLGELLYIDGILVAQNSAYTVVQQFNAAYWRVGDGNLALWTSAPTSYFFNGTIDEVRISTIAMTSLQVAKDYEAGLASLAGNSPNTINNSAGLLVSTGAPTGLYAQWHLDESSGTVALDASGNGNNGTMVANPPYVAGHDGLALSLNGTNQYFYSPLLPLFPTILTEELWFKTSAVPTGNEDLIGLNHATVSGTGSIDRLIRITPAGLVGFYVYNGAGNSIYSASAYNDGNWHHAAATLSPTFGMQLYVDGALVAANSGVTTASNYTDGGPYILVGSGETLFNGVIDEVRFSTVARNSLQIALDYLDDTLASQNSGKPYEVLYSSTTGASWAFLGASSTTLTGTNGTLAAQTLQGNAFSVLPSTGLNSTIDQVEIVAQNLGGNVTETKYYVILDTTLPTAPTIASLSNPTVASLQANGVTGSVDLLSGLAALPYDVQASTSATFQTIAGDTGWLLGPTATPAGLNANTTYYVRAQAISEDGLLSPYSNVVVLPTLSNPVSIPSGVPVAISSVIFTETWTALPTTPSSATCEGYELDLSTTNFAAGSTIYTATTTNVLANTLSISGLNPSTTVYIRVATLNWNGTPNYVALSSANIQISQNLATLVMGLDTTLQFSTVSVTAVGITNVGNLPVTLTLSGADVTASSPWALATSSGIETAVLQGQWNSAQPTSASFVTPITASPVTSSAVNYAGNQSGQALGVGATVTMYFKFWAPTSTTQLGDPHVLQILYQSKYP